jgi:hypothetical protein
VEVRDRTLSEASAGRDRGRAQFVGTDYAVGGTGSAPVHQPTPVQDSDRRHVGQGPWATNRSGPEILRGVRRTYRLARCCYSANLLRDRVQCIKYMYRELARGGVVKRGVLPQCLLDEF